MRTLLLYIGLLLLVLACVNTEKAIDKATKTEEAAEQTQDALKLRWPEMVEQKYADWFPARGTTETKTDTIADTVVKEVVVKGDSIPCPETTTRTTGRKYTPLVKQPDASYYNHLLKQQTNKVQESKATVAACQERENTLRKELAETRRLIEQQENRIRDQDDEVGRLRLALIVAGLLLVGVSFVRFRK